MRPCFSCLLAIDSILYNCVHYTPGRCIMGFRLRTPDGLIVEVDSTQELQAAIAVLRPQPPIINPTPSTLPLEADTLRRFHRTLKGGPRLVIQQLAKVDGPVQDDELRALLGFRSNNQLAGTMAGIAKKAKSQHLTLDQIVTKEQHQNGSGKHYLYRLTDAMRAAMA